MSHGGTELSNNISYLINKNNKIPKKDSSLILHNFSCQMAFENFGEVFFSS